MYREAKGGERDVFNEKPTREDQTMAVAAAVEKGQLATGCTIHTSMGDIVSGCTHPWSKLMAALETVPRAGTESRGKLCATCSGRILQQYPVPPYHPEIRELLPAFSTQADG